MNQEILDKRYKEFEKGLNRLTSEKSDPFNRLRATVHWINQALEEIKQTILQEGFKNPADEIHFFKKVKPHVKACLIYEVEYFRLRMDRPAGTKDMINGFYQKQLKKIQQVFREYDFQYHYFKSDSSELDHVFFIRRHDVSKALIYQNADPDPDPQFSTSMDFLFARFIASERLQNYLIGELLETGATSGTEAVISERGLVWTGEAINLVEVAYGLWLTGQVNNGEATISEIIYWLEQRFKLKIGRAYRRWTEISRRKLISPTKYLDQMKESINKRIDDENDIKRNLRRSSRKNDNHN